jgi:hypothetical protein
VVAPINGAGPMASSNLAGPEARWIFCSEVRPDWASRRAVLFAKRDCGFQMKVVMARIYLWGDSEANFKIDRLIEFERDGHGL